MLWGDLVDTVGRLLVGLLGHLWEFFRGYVGGLLDDVYLEAEHTRR